MWLTTWRARLPNTDLLLQAHELRALHPTLETNVQGGRLVAEGGIRGNALTARYRVRVEYVLGHYPRAFVLNPAPQRRHPRQPVIHTMGRDDEPCLFTPQHNDWRPSMSLARSIVPWLMEWLVFYEAWYYEGGWEGGGAMPPWFDTLASGAAQAAASLAPTLATDASLAAGAGGDAAA